MGIKVIFADINDFKDEELSSYFLLLPDYRKEKIYAYKNIEDKKRSLVAGYLLHQEIGDKDKLIAFNEYGKPYLPNEEHLFFSLSHSKDKVLLVVSDKEIGCDIEYMNRPIDYKFLTSIFAIENKDNVDVKEEYFKLWTIRESFGKCLGIGVYPLLKDKHFQIKPGYSVYKSEKIFEDYFYSIIVKN